MLDPAPIRNHEWDEAFCASLFIIVWLGLPAFGIFSAWMGW